MNTICFTAVAVVMILVCGWISAPFISRDIRDHRNQVRQLRRNKLQAKLARKQLLLESQIPHKHDWSAWGEVQETLVFDDNVSNVRPVRRKFRQDRKCNSCGMIDRRKVADG